MSEQPAAPDILTSLIVTLLAPMFLPAAGGNLQHASRAALETVSAGRCQTPTGLLGVAQVVAFGLAALGSLSLATADGLPTPLILRLRANASACSRSAEQNRRALHTAHLDAPPPAYPAAARDEARIIATVTATRHRAAEAQARALAPQSKPAPEASPPLPQPPAKNRAVAALSAQAPAAPTFSAPATADQQWQAIWAAAMADVAAEYTAEMPGLPPRQRHAASLRATALSNTASHLMSDPGPATRHPPA